MGKQGASGSSRTKISCTLFSLLPLNIQERQNETKPHVKRSSQYSLSLFGYQLDTYRPRNMHRRVAQKLLSGSLGFLLCVHSCNKCWFASINLQNLYPNSQTADLKLASWQSKHRWSILEVFCHLLSIFKRHFHHHPVLTSSSISITLSPTHTPCTAQIPLFLYFMW